VRVKQLEREADHSPLSGANVKNVWNYTSTRLLTPSWRSAQLKHI